MHDFVINNKAVFLSVLSVLKTQTDVNHPLNAAQIAAKIKDEYGINPDRRTIYSAIETLNQFNYGITYLPQRGYYLYERGIDPGVVKLLTDAVTYFPFLTAAQTKDIHKMLTATFSEYEKKNMPSVVSNPRKPTDAETLQSIDVLTQAIQTKKQVSFDYLKYVFNDKTRAVERQPREKGRITASPYTLDFFNGQYYLICYNPDHPNDPSALAVARMKDVRILKQAVEKKFSKDELETAVRNSVYAFTGNKELVTLAVDPDILTNVIETFGTGVKIYRADAADRRLRVVFSASTKGLFYWALQYLPHVEVIYPETLRQKIIEALQNNPYTAQN